MDNHGKKGPPAARPLQPRVETRRWKIQACSRVDFFLFKGCRRDVIFEGDCVANRFCPIASENLIF